MIRYLPDPTVQFVGGCLLTPPAFAALEVGGSARALGYFTDPFLLGSLFLTGAVSWVTSRSPDRYASIPSETLLPDSSRRYGPAHCGPLCPVGF